MKKQLLLLLTIEVIMTSMSMNAQVFQMYGEAQGLIGGSAVDAGWVWGSIDGAVDISNAFATIHKIQNCTNNGYVKVLIDGNEILTSGGVQSNDNPKDEDGGNPALTLKPAVSGGVIQLDAKKDGYVYIVAKLSTNKQYMVFEDGSAIGYKIAMEVVDARIPSNVLNLEIKGEGEYNHIPASVSALNGGTGISWVIREYLNDAEAATAGNGLGVLYFPVVKGCKYLAHPTGSKLNWCGIYFSETEAFSIKVAKEDGTELNLFIENFEKDGIIYGTSSPNTVEVLSLNSEMESVDIPQTINYNDKPYRITSIHSSAFTNCSGLTSVTIPNSVTSIGNFAFSGCSGLTSVSIGNNVTSIGNSAFSGCSSLTSITIPNSVTSIGNSAFRGCSGLTSITLSNSMTSIYYYTFFGCSGLTSITIPNSVTSIDVYAFSGCNKLATVISQIKEPFNIANNVFQGIANGATLFVPVGKMATYQATNYWNNFANIKELKNESITLSKGVVTFTSGLPLDFSNPINGLKAYTVSEVTDGRAVLTEVTTAVPAGTGLILKGTAGETYEIPYTLGNVTNVTNKLVGMLTATTIGGNDLDYILKDGKFVKASAGTLSAGKAYLKLDAALARGVVEIDGDATGVGAALTNSDNVKSEVYNLQGQRVSKPAKGLYVVDGKKVFVK